MFLTVEPESTSGGIQLILRPDWILTLSSSAVSPGSTWGLP